MACALVLFVYGLIGVHSVCSLSEADIYPSPTTPVFSCRKLKCPPGFSTFCSQSGESRCIPCVEGTFTENHSRRRECRPCDRCRDDQFELQPCTSTSNVICKECSQCGPGFGVLKPCERTRDTVCEKCRLISYSNIECNRGGSEGPPGFTNFPLDQTVKEGDETTFRCTANGNPTPKITWLKDGKTVAEGDTLTFAANRNDSGQYWCLARNELDVNIGNVSARLDVRYPPSWTTTPTDQTVIEDAMATFYCNATGNPVPSIVWMWDGKTVGSENTLSFKTSRNQSGEYWCSAENVYKAINTSVNLDVQFPPCFTSKPSDQTITEGDEASFHCNATGNPTPKITWIKNGKTVASGETFNIQTNRNHSGEYLCSAGNGLDVTVNCSVYLDIQFKPEKTSLSVDPDFIWRVKFGSFVKLNCIAFSHPPVDEYRFYRDQELLGSNTTGIYHVQLQISGLYVCVPVNSAGTGERATKYIDVMGALANNSLEVDECVNVTIALDCLSLEPPVIQNITDYYDLSWMVADFQVKRTSKPYWISLGRCNEKDCNRKRDIEGFAERIEISNIDRGTLFVKQLILHDQLTYKCEVLRANNRAPLVHRMNVTSSKTCLSSTVGESLDLSQPFRGTFSKETVEDMVWSTTLKDAAKVKVAYCNFSERCELVMRNRSYPEYLTRLKTDGMSVILTNVKQADRGLEFQCEMHLKLKPFEKYKVFIIRINEIVPRAVAGYYNLTGLTTPTSTIKTRGINVEHNMYAMPTSTSTLTSRHWLWAVVALATMTVAVLTLIGVNQCRRHLKQTEGRFANCPRPICRPPRCTGSSDCCDGASVSSATDVYTEQNKNWPVQVTIENDDSPPNYTVFDVFNTREQLDGTTRSYPEYITQVEATFNSSGGTLWAPDSNVRIIVDSGTVLEGSNQPFFFRVVYDETSLLRDIPETPDRTLISPVIQVGPGDIDLLKPVEMVVPHCLHLDEVKKEWITVYRCEHYSDEGPINWEKVPSASEKNCQSKAWFTVKKDSIHITTKVFSFWSVFVCGGSSRVISKKKRGTVFSNRPNPGSDLIYLRFYIYSDNEDSKKRVQAKDRERFPGSKASKEKPFDIYNDGNNITVKLSDLEDGWQLDKTNGQTYTYETAYGNKFRSEDSCDFAVKPTRQGVDYFSCILRFQQEDHPPENSIRLYPGFTPRQIVESTGSETLSNNNNNSSGTGAGSISVVPEETELEDSEGQEDKPSPVSLANVTEDFRFSSLGSDNEQVTEIHCRCINQQVGAGKWRDVLRNLSIEEVTIENLDEDYRKVAEKFYQGLLAWMRSRGTQRATTKTLCEALRLVGCSKALEKLSKEGVTSDAPASIPESNADLGTCV